MGWKNCKKLGNDLFWGCCFDSNVPNYLPMKAGNLCLQLNFLKLLLPTIIADVDKKFDDFSLN